MDGYSHSHNMQTNTEADQFIPLPNSPNREHDSHSNFQTDPSVHIDNREGNDVRNEVRILIENNKVGRIIGKGGTRVNAIRTQSRASVSVLQPNVEGQQPSERVISIKGKLSSIEVAIQLLCNAIGESKLMEQHQITLLTHQSFIGGVIGRGGATIKRTNAITGAMVHISSDALPASTEKTITVHGSMYSIAQALIIIIRQIFEQGMGPIEAFVPYEPQEGHPVIVQMKPRKILNQESSQSAIPSDMPPHGLPKSAYISSVFQSNEHSKRIRVTPNTPTYPIPFGPGPGGSKSPEHISSKQTIRTLSNSIATEETDSVGPSIRTAVLIIPNGAVGQIIGKRGAGITSIKQQTRTNISISNPDKSNPNERNATIKGPSAGVQRAVYWINQLLDNYYGVDNRAMGYLSEGGNHQGNLPSQMDGMERGRMAVGGINEFGVMPDTDSGQMRMGMDHIGKEMHIERIGRSGPSISRRRPPIERVGFANEVYGMHGYKGKKHIHSPH